MKHLAKLASVVAAGSIATAGLVAIGGAATAATTATYTCTFTGVDSGGQPTQVPVSVPITATFPNAALQSGAPVPAGTVPVSAVLDLHGLLSAPEVTTGIISQLGADGTLGGSVALDATHPVMLGSVPVTTTLSAPQGPVGHLISSPALTGSGTLNGFTPMGSGAEAVTLPASFVLTATGVTGASTGTPGQSVTFPAIPCASSTGAAVAAGTVTVNPVGASISVKAPKKVHAGKVANRFKVTVTGGKGTVVAKVGAKKVGSAKLNAAGKATVKVKGLKKGKRTIVFSLGTSTKSVKVKVVK